MPPRNERALARARLQLETPISNDESLPKLQEQAADYVAKHSAVTPKNQIDWSRR